MSRRRAGPEVVAQRDGMTVLRDGRRPTGRLLLQDDMEGSYVDLADPAHLEFDYLRRMRDLVDALGAADVLHVGGAACALARSLAVGRRGLRQEVVEADPGVLELAREHLGLRRAPGLRVRVGDGRDALARRPPASLDAVLIDAFVGARVPRHLATLEALQTARAALRPSGALAINVVDVPPLADVRAVAAGLAAVFAHVLAVGPGAVLRARRGGNVVLVAGDRELPSERLRARAAADPSPALVLGRGEIRGLTAGAAPWRD